MQTSPRERTFILYTHVLISFIAALWKIKIDNIKIAAIPFLVIFALLIGGILGLTAVKYFRLKQKIMGFMFTRGSILIIASLLSLFLVPILTKITEGKEKQKILLKK